MQPENIHGAPQGVENLPMPPTVGPETIPTLPPLETEQGALGKGHERREQAAEAGARASDAAAPADPAAVAVPSAPPPPPASPSTPAVSSTPLVAADEDLIEKEWVDKAKEIIEHTKDDPYARTAQVNELQRDYLKKRYGKVIGASEDG